MKTYVRIVLFMLALSSPAFAQWQVPQYAVPIGRGGGNQGFDSVTPGTAGWPLVSAGGASKPIYAVLGYAGGGTNAASQVLARNNMFPTPTRAGDITVWNGTAWVTLAGNNSGSNCLGENASGVPSWVTCSAGTPPGGSSGQVQYNNAGAFGGLTNTQLTALINVATATLSGALPAWPSDTTKFFRGDGTYAVVPASVITSGAALTKTDDTNVTVTLGGTPASALLAASSITVGWTGTLAVSRGGIGAGTFATGDLPCGAGTSPFTAVHTSAGAGGEPLVSNGATTCPTYQAITITSAALAGFGTGAQAPLGINVGSAGAYVVNGGALGTPSSGNGSNLTNIPTTALTGALQAAQEPAHTGDVTNTAGSLATTLVAGSASNLNSGTLAAARGGAGTISGALKGNGSGVVSQAACADLSDCTSGSWTPVLTFATPGNLSVSYSLQDASYTRVGNRVICNFVIATSAFTFTTASGNILITGLPFTSSNASANARWYAPVAFQGITKAGYTSFVGALVPNSTQMLVVGSGSGLAVSNVTAADTPTAGTMILAGEIQYNL